MQTINRKSLSILFINCNFNLLWLDKGITKVCYAVLLYLCHSCHMHLPSQLHLHVSDLYIIYTYTLLDFNFKQKQTVSLLLYPYQLWGSTQSAVQCVSGLFPWVRGMKLVDYDGDHSLACVVKLHLHDRVIKHRDNYIVWPRFVHCRSFKEHNVFETGSLSILKQGSVIHLLCWV